ncbi:hypothetical protein DMUE_3046 [Dictyocoela muelleri]|nr:hypothetical protein DMUE_3046 [Dictyocoela muelleri]
MIKTLKNPTNGANIRKVSKMMITNVRFKKGTLNKKINNIENYFLPFIYEKFNMYNSLKILIDSVSENSFINHDIIQNQILKLINFYNLYKNSHRFNTKFIRAK